MESLDGVLGGGPIGVLTGQGLGQVAVRGLHLGLEDFTLGREISLHHLNAGVLDRRQAELVVQYFVQALIGMGGAQTVLYANPAADAAA